MVGRQAARSGEGRRLRVSLDLSLRDGAKRIGVDASTLSRWERGLSRPRSNQALRYGDVIAGWLSTIEILEGAK